MAIEGAPVGPVLATGLLLMLVLLTLHRRNGNLKPLPPGPKKLPLLGNILDMPSSFQWIKFSQWAEKFGSDIIHLKVARTDYIVLSSHDAVTDLLDKRSSIYSSRPHATMLYDLVGWNRDLLLMSYGEDWKAHRKLFQQEFHPNHTSFFRPQEKKAVKMLLNRLLETPEDWVGHIGHMGGMIILSVAYGIHIQPQNDPNVEAAEKMMSVLNAASLPGAFLVDAFPILKYVPSWFPGASFKRKAKAWNGILAATITPPFMAVKKAMANGSAEDCFTVRCLQNAKHSDPRLDILSEEEEIIKETAGTMYEGGADTGITALRTFILAMLCFPYAQREAQEELDRIIGNERLPEHEDKDSLPYVTAVIYECLRWQPIVPLAFPHRVDTEDTYRGYHIPKNSVVLPNVWEILHDPAVYGPNAHEYEPKRWLIKTNGGGWKLKPDMRDPASMNFGFGRRVCPGKHMALSTLWLNVASLLHSFNISEALDGAGNPIKPRVKYVTGLIYHPAPFKCTIKPRSEEHIKIIKQALVDEPVNM